MRALRFAYRWSVLRTRLRHLIVPAAVLLVLSFSRLPLMSMPVPDLLGLRPGMKISEIRELFSRNGIALTEKSPREFVAPRTPGPLEGVREVCLVFTGEALERISITFELPPRDPTAANLIALYDKEKERLTGLFGVPSQDVAQMKAPTSLERYQWLTRGLAYYQTTWLVENQLKVALWLYAEDEGIVFTEIYETVQPR